MAGEFRKGNLHRLPASALHKKRYKSITSTEEMKVSRERGDDDDDDNEDSGDDDNS